MLVDTITMTAFGGAVLALAQWMTIRLAADDQPLVSCAASKGKKNLKTRNESEK